MPYGTDLTGGRFNRRAWREAGYALVGLPLGVLGLPYVVITLVVGGRWRTWR